MSQLNWFEFETRMRRIVTELLEPTISRITNDREQLVTTQSTIETYKKKVDEIETLLGLGQKKSGWMEDIEQSLQKNLQKIFDLEKTSFCTTQGLENSLGKHTIDITAIFTKLQGLEDTNSQIESQINSLQSSLTSQAFSITSYLENNKKEFTEKYNSIVCQTNDAVKRSEQINNKLNETSNKINDIQIVLDRHRGLINELNMQVAKINNEKVSYDDFINESEKFHAKFLQGNEKAMRSDDRIEGIIRFINLYLPTDIQTMISDTMYAIKDKKMLVKYYMFEDRVISELESNYSKLETYGVDEIFNRALGGKARMIKRNKDFKFSQEKIEKSQKFNRNPVIKKKEVADSDLDDSESIKISTPFNKSIEIKELETELKNKIAILSEEIKKIREEVYSNYEKNLIFVEMFEKDNNDIKNKQTEIKNSFRQTTDSLSAATKAIEADLSRKASDLKIVKDLCKEFLEIGLMQYNLTLHDENEKKNYFVEKPPENKKIYFELESETAKSSRLKSSQAYRPPHYKPTPLYYKDVLYERQEMIEIIGENIKSVWNKATQFLGFRVKKISDIPARKTDDHRATSAYNSRKIIKSSV
jgi:hypothetical protein